MARLSTEQIDRIRDMAVQIFDCAARGHNGKDPVPNCPACGPLANNRQRLRSNRNILTFQSAPKKGTSRNADTPTTHSCQAKYG